MAKIKLLTQEQIAQEEAEAQERGLTIFQLRRYKKDRELREQKKIGRASCRERV